MPCHSKTKEVTIGGVNLDPESYLDQFLAHVLCHCRGNLTFVSQKSLMLFTRLSNSSSCTGFVR
jgi:hypothetical protein